MAGSKNDCWASEKPKAPLKHWSTLIFFLDFKFPMKSYNNSVPYKSKSSLTTLVSLRFNGVSLLRIRFLTSNPMRHCRETFWRYSQNTTTAFCDNTYWSKTSRNSLCDVICPFNPSIKSNTTSPSCRCSGCVAPHSFSQLRLEFRYLTVLRTYHQITFSIQTNSSL